MSELLKFPCPVPNCGRKFYTNEKLENHIKIRHPLFSSSPSTNQTEPDKKEENKITESSIKNNNIIIEKNSINEEKKEIKEIKNNNNNLINNEITTTPNKINIQQNINQADAENKNSSKIKIKEKEKKDKDKNSNVKKEKNNSIINKENKKQKKAKKEKLGIKLDNNNNIEKEINKKIEEIENKITETDKSVPTSKMKDKKIDENKEKLEKEKHKIILDNLYSKINSLENYFENETLELQKQFELSEIPVFEDIVMDDDNKSEKNSEKEDKHDDDNKDEDDKNNSTNNSPKENIQQEKEDSNNDNASKDKKDDKIENVFDLTEQQKNYDIGKIIEITDEMVFKDTKYEDYDEFIELDLSKKNIASFMNNRNIPFEEFTELTKLNLSYNWMTYTYDIRFFTKLKELYINDNTIDDLGFCESLPNLEILNAENNQISFITPLAKSINLKILKLSLNKIEFLNSTLNTIKNLKKLEELTIKDNPFLTQLFAYKQYFIYNYQNILKLDEEEINDIDRDIAGRFVRENNSMYANSTKRPMSSRPGGVRNNISKNENNENLKKIEENNEENEEDESIGDNNIFSQTQTTFRVGNAIITKEMYVPYKGKDNNKINKMKKEEKIQNKDNKDNKDNKEIQELKQIINEQQNEIDNIKLELENINQLNKEYELIIQDYKIKLEQKKIEQKNKNKISKEEEKNKLLKELEMWKKEYYDLFNKTKDSSSIITKDSEKPKLLSNNLIKKHYDNYFKEKEKDINLYKSTPNNEIKNIFNRPQTARVKSTKSTDFDNICEGIKIMYRKNEFADVLEENTDDDEEEEEKKNEEKNDKEEEMIKEEEKDLIEEKEPIIDQEEKDYDGNDIIPDDDIDELFRKSCADIQKMREEIKFMNENIDKNQQNNKNNINKAGKIKLNPVIVKKENNPNFKGNRGIFDNNQNKI